MSLFFTIFFSIYTAINYYIFIRGWQVLEAFPHLRYVYAFFFFIFFSSYILAKVLVRTLQPAIYDAMLWVGSFWFAFMIYFLLSIIFIDILRFVLMQLNIMPEMIRQNYQFAKQTIGIVVVLIVSTTVLIGYLNTTDITTKNLYINLPKGNGKLTELNAVMLSDIHLSPLDNEHFLSALVNKINSLKPDIVFIPGDLFDDHAFVLNQRNIGPSLLKLKPKYGVFACTGNHEFINGIESAVEFMQTYGLQVLRDSSILIDNSFYIAGRDDRSKKQFTREDRKSLEEIMQPLDKNYPVILMDHTPFGLAEAEKNNVALQLSGHTHHGQMFPANLITKMIYEVSWGYLKKGNTQYYVSCGAGTWGPRVRLGSNSEIVSLKIKFTD